MANSVQSPKMPTPPVWCQVNWNSRRMAGLLMAGPFVFCFALFGTFNVIAGTVVTIMACKPRFTPETLALWEELMRLHHKQQTSSLDPLKVVGCILLLTGTMLVLVGVALGVVACRSVNLTTRRRRSEASFSGIQLSSINGPTSFVGVSTVNHPSFPSRSMSLPERKRSMSSGPASRSVSIDIHEQEDRVDEVASHRLTANSIKKKSWENVPEEEEEDGDQAVMVVTS